MWPTNKQGPRQGVCLGNISNTYMGQQTWSRAESFHVNERLKRGAWEKQSTYSHNRMPFSRADRKSLVPNFFLVTAWKTRECNKQWEKWGEGLGEERGQGFVCVRWGGLEKKGRMLRTVAEEVEGISSRVPTVSLEQSWAQFFRYPLGALGGSTPLTLMLKATGKW